MANYSIVVDTSNFKPFDINPALHLIQMFNDLAWKTREAASKVMEEMGVVDLPDPGENELARKIYDAYLKYNSDFKKASDDFSYGMNANNKKRMLDAVMRYGTEGKPIKQAMNDYNTWLDNLNNIRIQDPSAIIGNGNLSIYDFYGGKKPTIKYLNGDKIELDTIATFTALGNQVLQDPVFEDCKQAIGYKWMRQGKGFNAQDLLEAAAIEYQNRGGQYSGLVGNLLLHMNKYFDKLGLDEKGYSDDAKKEVWNRIASGVIKSIREPKEELVQDKKWDIAKTLADIAYTLANTNRINSLLPYEIASAKESLKKTRAANSSSASGMSYDKQLKELKARAEMIHRSGYDPATGTKADSETRKWAEEFMKSSNSGNSSNRGILPKGNVFSDQYRYKSINGELYEFKVGEDESTNNMGQTVEADPNKIITGRSLNGNGIIKLKRSEILLSEPLIINDKSKTSLSRFPGTAKKTVLYTVPLTTIDNWNGEQLPELYKYYPNYTNPKYKSKSSKNNNSNKGNISKSNSASSSFSRKNN